VVTCIAHSCEYIQVKLNKIIGTAVKPCVRAWRTR